jgi:hypothetical protein
VRQLYAATCSLGGGSAGELLLHVQAAVAVLVSTPLSQIVSTSRFKMLPKRRTDASAAVAEPGDEWPAAIYLSDTGDILGKLQLTPQELKFQPEGTLLPEAGASAPSHTKVLTPTLKAARRMC